MERGGEPDRARERMPAERGPRPPSVHAPVQVRHGHPGAVHRDDAHPSCRADERRVDRRPIGIARSQGRRHRGGAGCAPLERSARVGARAARTAPVGDALHQAVLAVEVDGHGHPVPRLGDVALELMEPMVVRPQGVRQAYQPVHARPAIPIGRPQIVGDVGQGRPVGDRRAAGRPVHARRPAQAVQPGHPALDVVAHGVAAGRVRRVVGLHVVVDDSAVEAEGPGGRGRTGCVLPPLHEGGLGVVAHDLPDARARSLQPYPRRDQVVPDGPDLGHPGGGQVGLGAGPVHAPDVDVGVPVRGVGPPRLHRGHARRGARVEPVARADRHPDRAGRPDPQRRRCGDRGRQDGADKSSRQTARVGPSHHGPPYLPSPSCPTVTKPTRDDPVFSTAQLASAIDRVAKEVSQPAERDDHNLDAEPDPCVGWSGSVLGAQDTTLPRPGTQARRVRR